MKMNRIFFLVFLSLAGLKSYAQKSELKKAVSFFDRGEYYWALENYKIAENMGATLGLDDQKRKARSLYYLNDIDNAYTAFNAIEDKLTGNDVFLYASTTHKFALYEGAIDWYEKSKSQGANPMQVNELVNSCRWALQNASFLNYRVNPSSLLTFGQSFGIQYFKNGVVYSSAEEGGKKKDKQGKDILNLFYSDVVDGDIQEGSRLFSRNLQFPSHVGAISFTSDFKYMYYTKAVRVKGGVSRIKIFMVEHDGKDWVNETEISINSDDYDCAHPAISPDDKYIYFVSNKKGGYGGKDLYYAERRGPNSFGNVANLGNEVNTYGDEVFPFISKDNKLYFSSDGHIGFGGLDLFEASMQDGKWKNVANLMKPFNSNKDDFGYVVDPNDASRGFLSSNNFGTGEKDVIFYVSQLAESAAQSAEMLMPIAGLENIQSGTQPVASEIPVVAVNSNLPGALQTAVISTFNGTPVAGAELVLKNASTGDVVATGKTDATGKIILAIPDALRVDGQEFELTVSKGREFHSKSMILSIHEVEELGKTGLSLTPIFNDSVLDDISGMSLPYGGTELGAEGYKILDKLAAYLLSNPNIVVKLNAHTEARGEKLNNLHQSQAMSEKAEAYLISKGVKDENLIPRGYGERYLLNKCRRGIYCEQSAHQKNRRVEVVVWKIKK